MPKYSQTLTATTYTETDFSTSLKTAMDNLGWGTGKVDIAGGYRFTATDATNSQTTPLSLSSANFLDNYYGGNLAYPVIENCNPGHNAYNGIWALSMYLPGVTKYRIKFTPLGDGVTKTNGNTVSMDNNNQGLFPVYYTTRVDRDGTLDNTSVAIEQWVLPTTLTLGTQYTTDWTTGEVCNYPMVMIRNHGSMYTIRIDSIEWQVGQNKFAFQSPNLDSPTFEAYSLNYGGNLVTTLTTYPIKNSKNAVARLTQMDNLSNNSNIGQGQNYSFATNLSYIQRATLMQEYGRSLFNTNPDTVNFGKMSQVMNIEYLSYGGFGFDMTLRTGSNSTFDGFYINTKNNGIYQGTVWDTLVKSSAYSNSTPIYPSVRRTVINAPRTATNPSGDMGTSVEGYLSHSKDQRVAQVYKVKNQCTIEGAYINLNYGNSNPGPSITIRYALAKADYINGTFKITGIVQPWASKTSVVATGNNYYNLPISATLDAGYYLLLLSPISFKGNTNVSNLSENTTLEPSDSRDIVFIGNINGANENTTRTINGVRYIRESFDSNSVNISGHVVEIQALTASDVNLAAGKSVTSSDNSASTTSLNYVTDGAKNSNNFTETSMNTGWIMVDLGQVYTTVNRINVTNYFADARTYYSRLEISEDGINWATVYDYMVNGTYVETSSGRTHNISFPYTGAGTQDFTDSLKVNAIYGLAAPSLKAKTTYVVFPNSGLLQIGSSTPVNQRTSFAENWVSFGKFGQYGGTRKIKEKVSKGYWSSAYPAAAFTTRAVFGMDLQSLNLNVRDESMFVSTLFMNMQNSGIFSGNNYGNGVKQSVEFGPTYSNTPNNNAYYRAWSINVNNNIGFLHNNIYQVMEAPTDLNTSFVTPDGAEYVYVMYSADYNYSAIAFKIG